MMVLQARHALHGNPTECSLAAALQSLLAYGRGLEASRIEVSVVEGRVILSGEVASPDAFETAIAVAEVFSGRTVVPDLVIRPSGAGFAGVTPHGVSAPTIQECSPL